MWRYFAGSISKNAGIIRMIKWEDKTDSFPPIYKWKVILSNNTVYDLYDARIYDNKDLTHFDKKVLEDAFTNDKELTKKEFEKIKTKIF